MESERPYDVPEDRHYDGTRHLWVQRDPASGLVRVGIDAIGLEALGELAYIQLKAAGTAVARGESLGTLEAAKMTSNIVAPVSGTIVGRNDAVLQDPLAVNDDPYERGWLVELDPTRWDEEAAELVSGEAIAGWVAAEVERFRAEASTD